MITNTIIAKITKYISVERPSEINDEKYPSSCQNPFGLSKRSICSDRTFLCHSSQRCLCDDHSVSKCQCQKNINDKEDTSTVFSLLLLYFSSTTRNTFVLRDSDGVIALQVLQKWHHINRYTKNILILTHVFRINQISLPYPSGIFLRKYIQ